MLPADSAQATALFAKDARSANRDCVLLAVLEDLALGQAAWATLSGLIHPTDELLGL